MNLLLDLGNSSLKWALEEGGQRVHSGRVSHDRLGGEAFAQWHEARERIHAIVAVSTAPESVWQSTDRRLREVLQRSVQPLRTPDSGYGVRSAYRESQRMGADRWVAMVAAVSLGPLPAVVVDCGTAVTVDWLDEGGIHRGGLILAGVGAQFEALGRRAPVLAGRRSAENVSLFATDTEAAVHGGVLQGAAAMIDGVIRRMEVARGPAAQRWLAGGDARSLIPLLETELTMRPDLVLDGLAVIAGSA